MPTSNLRQAQMEIQQLSLPPGLLPAPVSPSSMTRSTTHHQTYGEQLDSDLQAGPSNYADHQQPHQQQRSEYGDHGTGEISNLGAGLDGSDEDEHRWEDRGVDPVSGTMGMEFEAAEGMGIRIGMRNGGDAEASRSADVPKGSRKERPRLSSHWHPHPHPHSHSQSVSQSYSSTVGNHDPAIVGPSKHQPQQAQEEQNLQGINASDASDAMEVDQGMGMALEGDQPPQRFIQNSHPDSRSAQDVQQPRQTLSISEPITSIVSASLPTSSSLATPDTARATSLSSLEISTPHPDKPEVNGSAQTDPEEAQRGRIGAQPVVLSPDQIKSIALGKLQEFERAAREDPTISPWTYMAQKLVSFANEDRDRDVVSWLGILQDAGRRDILLRVCQQMLELDPVLTKRVVELFAAESSRKTQAQQAAGSGEPGASKAAVAPLARPPQERNGEDKVGSSSRPVLPDKRASSQSFGQKEVAQPRTHISATSVNGSKPLPLANGTLAEMAHWQRIATMLALPPAREGVPADTSGNHKGIGYLAFRIKVLFIASKAREKAQLPSFQPDAIGKLEAAFIRRLNVEIKKNNLNLTKLVQEAPPQSVFESQPKPISKGKGKCSVGIPKPSELSKPAAGSSDPASQTSVDALPTRKVQPAKAFLAFIKQAGVSTDPLTPPISQQLDESAQVISLPISPDTATLHHPEALLPDEDVKSEPPLASSTQDVDMEVDSQPTASTSGHRLVADPAGEQSVPLESSSGPPPSFTPPSRSNPQAHDHSSGPDREVHSTVHDIDVDEDEDEVLFDDPPPNVRVLPVIVVSGTTPKKSVKKEPTERVNQRREEVPIPPVVNKLLRAFPSDRCWVEVPTLAEITGCESGSS